MNKIEFEMAVRSRKDHLLYESPSYCADSREEMQRAFDVIGDGIVVEDIRRFPILTDALCPRVLTLVALTLEGEDYQMIVSQEKVGETWIMHLEPTIDLARAYNLLNDHITRIRDTKNILEARNELMNPGIGPVSECDNCRHTFLDKNLDEVKDYFQRVDQDTACTPTGQCPGCGALCYRTLKRPDMKDYIVSLHEDKGDKFTMYFVCMADDPDHAEEQAVNAYPNCEIINCALKEGEL